jgi:hypothetical protein
VPIEQIRSPQQVARRSLGWIGAKWIEHFCIHGPGDIAGTPLLQVPLSYEQFGLLRDAYALAPVGRRLYDSVFLSRPKGASKSAFASWIAIFEAIGPCRFQGFAAGGETFQWRDFRYVYSPGEPMGRRIHYPFVRLMATEEGQTGNTYQSVLLNFQDGPLREIFAHVDDAGITRTYLPDGGEIRPSTASSAAKEGGKETWSNFDETWLYVHPELRRMYQTVRRNLTKRKESEPWSFETSTMFVPGEDSVAEQSYEQAELIRDGKVRRGRMLFDHREAPPLTNEQLADDALLTAGLVEAYGDASSYIDIDRIKSEIWDTRNDPNDSRRHFLNQRTAVTDAWLAPQEWDVLADPAHKVPPKAIITLGFDGSKGDDWTAAVGCEVATGFIWPLGIWQPDEDGGIDREAVDGSIRRAFDRYDVVAMYADVELWESYIDQWNRDFKAGLCVHSGAKNSIAWDMRGKRLDTVKMIESFHSAVVDKTLSQSGDKVLASHVYNARRRPNAYGVDIGKEAPKSQKKIDAAIASCLAWQARRDYLALDKKKQRRVRTGKAMFIS